MIRPAILPDRLHLACSPTLTVMIETADAMEAVISEVPEYAVTGEVEHAIERTRQNLAWLAQHGLVVEDGADPAGAGGRPQNNPDALVEVIAGMTAAKAYLGHALGITDLTEHGIIIRNGTTGAIVTLTWTECLHCSAIVIGDILAAEFAPERFTDHHAAHLRMKIAAECSGVHSTGPIDEQSAVVPADEQEAQRAEDAEQRAARCVEQSRRAAIESTHPENEK